MSEHRVSETKLREQQELAAEAARISRSSSHLVWKILGGAAIALVAAGLVASMKDIKRYIRIARM
jgi:hypothetical protein